MKTVLVLCAGLILAGCASTRTAPPVISKPVILPCQTDVPDRPVLPADSLTDQDDLWAIGTALWADRLAREAYEIAIRTRLIGCTKP